MNIRLVVVLLTWFCATGSLAGGVYKWTDETGQVHFTDSPPNKANAEHLLIEDTAKPVTSVSDEATVFSETPVAGVEHVTSVDVSEEESHDAYRVISGVQAVACLDSLESLLDPKKKMAGHGEAGVFAPMEPRKLERRELEKLKTLLSTLSGRWSGHIEEAICLGPDSAVREKVRIWQSSVRGSWLSDGILKLWFDRTRDDGVRNQTMLWISVKDSWLRSALSTGAPSNVPNPRAVDDVEILSVARDGVAFMRTYRRRAASGCSIQVSDVWSVYSKGRELQLALATYTQGRMVERSKWSFHK